MTGQAGGNDAACSKVDVTSEMVVAGVDELRRWNDDFESAEDAVVRIFEAMIEAGAGQDSARKAAGAHREA